MLDQFGEHALELAMAVVLGGAIGLERELNGEWAGLRTHILVAMGTAIFVLAGLRLASPDVTSRVIQGVATGVGFIGAGTILKSRQPLEVHGLTTAASIWVAAALGAACSLREFGLAISATVITVVVLVALRPVDRWLSGRRKQ